MKKILLLFCLIQSLNIANAQIINIDRELNSDSILKNWQFQVAASYSSDKQQNNINDLNTSFEVTRFLANKYAIIAAAQVNSTISGRTTIQNEGFLHLRYRDVDSRKLSPEYYMQYQWNGAWGMQSRALYGANLRYKILDRTGFDLFTGIGLFQQYEVWNWNGVNDIALYPNHPDLITDNKLRVNNYLKLAKKIARNLDFAITSIQQFNAISIANNPHFRWYLIGQVNYDINKNFKLSFNWDHVYDFKPLLPINKFYYGYSTTLNLVF